MIISDIIIEAPVGMMKRIGNRFASMVPGQTSVKAYGRRQTGEVANQVKKSLIHWMGTTGQGKLTFQNFAIFMKDLKLPIPAGHAYKINNFLSRQMIDQLILQSIQQRFRDKHSKTTTTTTDDDAYKSYPGSKKSKSQQPQQSQQSQQSQQKVDLSQVSTSELLDALSSRGQVSGPDHASKAQAQSRPRPSTAEEHVISDF